MSKSLFTKIFFQVRGFFRADDSGEFGFGGGFDFRNALEFSQQVGFENIADARSIVQNRGATSQGKTYKNAQAAGVTKPVFPDIQLSEGDRAFLENIKANDVDSAPVFKDGVSFFEAYIVPHFRVSPSMSGRSAVVHYAFTVGEDGKISDVTITSSTDNAFANELARVIKHSPKWKPAMKDGKPVPYTIKNQTAHFGQVD